MKFLLEHTIQITVAAMFIGLLATFLTYFNKKNAIAFSDRLVELETNNRIQKVVLVIGGSVLFLAIVLLTYGSIDDFSGTKGFREEYNISAFDALIGDGIQEVLIKLDGGEKEWGEWVLERVQQVRWLISYVVAGSIWLMIMPIVGKPKFEKKGIRTVFFLLPWDKPGHFTWEDNEIVFTNMNKKSFYYHVKPEDKAVLKKYLNDNYEIN